MFLHIGREGDETSLAKHKQKKIAFGNRWLTMLMKRTLCTFNQWQFYWFGQRSNETCLQRKKKRIQDFKIYIQHGQISMIFCQIIWTWNVEWHLEFTNRWNVLYFFSELLWTDESSWNFYKIKYIEFRLTMICHWQSFLYRKFSIIFIINKAELFWYCTWQKADEF